MAAQSTDLLTKVGTPGTATTLAAPGHSIGGNSFTVGSTANWPTDTGIVFAVDQVTTQIVNGVSTQVRVANTYTEWEGVVSSSTQITGATLKYGTDQNYSAGVNTRVYIPVASSRENNLVTWGTTQHNQNGTHAAVTATSLSVSGTTALTGALTLNLWDGWIASPDTWAYASATSFTISGVDRTAQFPVGAKIKLTQTSPKYFYVASSSFSTNTTVNITGGSDYSLANATITSPSYSYGATPQGFPQWFNYAPTITGFSANPVVVTRFSVNGRLCTVAIHTTSVGTSNAGTFTMTAPLTAATVSGNVWESRGIAADGGVSAQAGAVIASGASTITFYNGVVDSGTTWTASGSKYYNGTLTYEV